MDLIQTINNTFEEKNGVNFIKNINEINDGIILGKYYKLFSDINKINTLWEESLIDVDNDIYEYYTTKSKISYFKSKGWLNIKNNETVLICPKSNKKLLSKDFKCIEELNIIQYWIHEFNTDDGEYIILKIKNI